MTPNIAAHLPARPPRWSGEASLLGTNFPEYFNIKDRHSLALIGLLVLANAPEPLSEEKAQERISCDQSSQSYERIMNAPHKRPKLVYPYINGKINQAERNNSAGH
jgi:hypothetical protein